MQRGFARRPGGAVLDGRDIGTVICPEASLQNLRHRERRRARDAARAGIADARRESRLRRRAGGYPQARPARQQPRRGALKPAADAVVLDTTKLDVDAAFKAALAIVEAACAGVPAQTAV